MRQSGWAAASPPVVPSPWTSADGSTPAPFSAAGGTTVRCHLHTEGPGLAGGSVLALDPAGGPARSQRARPPGMMARRDDRRSRWRPPQFQGVIGDDSAGLDAVVAPRAAAAGGRANVVLVVFDDVGFAQLGCYGSDIATPPSTGWPPRACG